MIDLWTAMAGTEDGDHLDPTEEIPIGEAYRLAAEWLEYMLQQLDGYYPADLWPKPSEEQMKALHEFAPTVGMTDGSSFHVNGIRHALGLVRTSVNAGPE